MRLEIQKDKCTGCKDCENICSEHHFRETNPAKSAIRIVREDSVNGLTKEAGDQCFTPEVCDQCGECADICLSTCIQEKGNGCCVLDPGTCMSCWDCVEACPLGVLHKNKELGIPIKCDLCLKCTEVCETGALTAVE